MKICLLIHGLNTKDGGGRFSFDLVSNLKSTGQEIQVLTNLDLLKNPIINIFKIRKIFKNSDIIHAVDIWPNGFYARLISFGLKKPIIITDSGELRPWRTPMQLSDIFGTTLYRVIDNPWLGPFQYPLRPWFYRTKSDLIRKVFAPQNQKTIISEFQAEPWAMQPLTEIPIKEQLSKFPISRLQETVDFARKTGFPEAYFWGVEWWYYLAKNDHPEYLNYAKTLF